MVYMIYNDKLQVTVTMNDRLQDYNMFVMAQNCKIMVYDEFSDECKCSVFYQFHSQLFL